MTATRPPDRSDRPGTDPRPAPPARLADLDAPSGARFSGCRRYRHVLWRSWDPGAGAVVFVGLNPSTADASRDDPTIRRCRTFARDWGFGALVMVNLFDVRATDPAVMKRRAAPLSRANDAVLLASARDAALVVAAWGAHGVHRGRADAVRTLLSGHGVELRCFGTTAGGEPLHPLYQRRERRADAVLAAAPGTGTVPAP